MRKFYRWFPSGYYLDLSEPDLHILKRPDDSMVAAFFPEAAEKETLQRTAHEDYWEQSENLTNSEPNV
ncbi:MAG: hypothetical protein WA982_00150 [Rubrobacteraceae bacterium]